MELLPPLMINSVLGTILFFSQSYFCWALTKVPFLAPRTLVVVPEGGVNVDGCPQSAPTSISTDPYDDPTSPTWLLLPSPNSTEDTFIILEASNSLPHPTLLSALAGMMAGVLQGIAFTPVENT